MFYKAILPLEAKEWANRHQILGNEKEVFFPSDYDNFEIRE